MKEKTTKTGVNQIETEKQTFSSQKPSLCKKLRRHGIWSGQKDIIVEEGRNVSEVLDLALLLVCVWVTGCKELLEHREVIVSTKYPQIAKDYFYNKKHQTVES